LFIEENKMSLRRMIHPPIYIAWIL